MNENEKTPPPVMAPTKNLTFGTALNALKDGKMVSREGWNGKGLFVFMQIPAKIDMAIVPKMQSLPQSVKNEFDKRFNATATQANDIDPIYFNSITYNNQLALVSPFNEISGWSPSTTDALSEDWTILN